MASAGLKDEFRMRPNAPSRRMCWEVHPPLTVGRGRVIYGGNCALPAVKDADLYIGLDASFRKTSDTAHRVHYSRRWRAGGYRGIQGAGGRGCRISWTSGARCTLAALPVTAAPASCSPRWSPTVASARPDLLHAAALLPCRGRDAHAGRFPGRALRLQAGACLIVRQPISGMLVKKWSIYSVCRNR